MIKLGIDRISDILDNYKNLNGGLLTNATGINSNLDMTVDILMENEIRLKKLFGPEHGLWGVAPDGKRVKDEVHPVYGIPIYSLYGETEHPTDEMLSDLDVIFYDIQDMGLRFYTYIYSLGYMMEECGKHGIKMVVFDRPNPLSGKVEGPIIKDDRFVSFVGGYNLSLRYGLTVGELARYYNDRFNMGVTLDIVKMEGWRHDMYYDDTGLFWNTPSPSIPTFEHGLLYTGMALFEGTNISEGRGTSHPFKYIGAPWIDSRALVKEIKAHNHKGIAIRERRFTPYISKYRGEVCNGIELFIEDKKDANPLQVALDLIITIKNMYPNRFKWDTLYHEAKGRHHFDLLIGGDSVREMIERGVSAQDIIDLWKEEEEEFKRIAKEYWIYE